MEQLFVASSSGLLDSGYQFIEYENVFDIAGARGSLERDELDSVSRPLYTAILRRAANFCHNTPEDDLSIPKNIGPPA